MLAVLAVTRFFIGESLQTHLFSVNNYLVVQRFACRNVFHPSNKLKAVRIELLHVANCYSRVRVFLVIFLDEGLGHVLEF